MIALEFTRRFSMAHRLLSDRTSKCAIPHGHNELVTVRLGTELPLDLGDTNMAAPFAVLKRRWSRWIDDYVDHAFQVRLDDPLVDYFEAQEPDLKRRLMTFAGDPTTEALAAAFAAKISAFMAEDGLPFRCERIEVEETPTNRVVLERAWDLSPYEGWMTDSWMRRSDMSINDLLPASAWEAAGEVAPLRVT